MIVKRDNGNSNEEEEDYNDDYDDEDGHIVIYTMHLSLYMQCMQTDTEHGAHLLNMITYKHQVIAV